MTEQDGGTQLAQGEKIRDLICSIENRGTKIYNHKIWRAKNAINHFILFLLSLGRITIKIANLFIKEIH